MDVRSVLQRDRACGVEGLALAGVAFPIGGCRLKFSVRHSSISVHWIVAGGFAAGQCPVLARFKRFNANFDRVGVALARLVPRMA